MATTAEDRRLEGWKEIADALGVAVRTAQDWHARRGLPVRRGFRRRWQSLAVLRRWQEANDLREAA